MSESYLERSLDSYRAAMAVLTNAPATDQSEPERNSRFNNVPSQFLTTLLDVNCLAGILFLHESQTGSTKPPLAEAQILNILISRDKVQAALAQTNSISETTLATLRPLDDQLKEKAGEIAPIIQAADWRSSMTPDEKAWWWFLESPKPDSGWERWDWLWKAVSVTSLTVSLGLVGEISSRFLTGGPDALGAILVSTQSVLSLLAAGGALTQAGREAGSRLFKSRNVPERYWQEIGAGFSGLLLVGVLGLRLSLPVFASWYANWGWDNYQEGDWGSAEEDYQRALQLNPDDALAHFRLGLLYENLQNFDLARTQYQLAMQGGEPIAINNLARLHIFNKNYSAAASLIREAKALAAKRQQPLDDNTEYAMLKNLGWARFKQGNYPDARRQLEEAINLQKSANIKENLAAPYCLRAQVKEAQGEKAWDDWNQCNAKANPNFPEEDKWVWKAQKRLAERLEKEAQP